eukprot:5132708-Pleurochrysis_carterae.AAC.4
MPNATHESDLHSWLVGRLQAAQYRWDGNFSRGRCLCLCLRADAPPVAPIAVGESRTFFASCVANRLRRCCPSLASKLSTYYDRAQLGVTDGRKVP